MTDSQAKYKIKLHEDKCRDNRTKGTGSHLFHCSKNRLQTNSLVESIKRSPIQTDCQQNGNGTRTLCQYRKEWQWI